MWTLLFIAALVLITFRMFVWHHEDRDRVPFEATLTDEDRARLHQLIERQLATGQKSLQVSGTVVSVSDRKCADEFIMLLGGAAAVAWPFPAADL
jgi:hypothetical protein